jgi:hypothetical protein
MKKWHKRLGITLLVILSLLIISTSLVGDYLIKQTVNTAGPKLLRVPVSLEDVTFRPILGRVALKGLHIGNPEGFKSKSLFDIARLDIRLRVRSLFTSKIIIDSIDISGTELTYERNLKTSNIDSLMTKLAPPPAAGEEKEIAKPSQKEAPGKKVIIKKLSINGTRVHVALTALGGHGFILPLPPIYLSNIGGNEDGVTFSEALTEIMGAIVKSVSNAVVGSGKLLGSSAAEIGKGAEKAVEGIKNLFK